MKKKFVSMLLSAVLVTMALAGCGAGGNAPESSTTPAAESTENAESAENVEPSGETDTAPADNTQGTVKESAEPTTELAEAEPAKEKYQIACLTRGLYHNYHQSVKAGLDAAAKDCGIEYTFQGTENETQVDKQVEMLSTIIDQKPDAIILGPLDSEAVMPQLERAKEAGIPVIIIDQPVDSDIPICTITTYGHANGGIFMADKINELYPNEEKVQVAIIASDQYSDYSVQRRDAFIEKIKDYPQIELVDIQYSDGGDQLKAADGTKAIIEAYPDLKVIIGSGEGNAVGVLNALKELGKEGEYTVLGFDSGKVQLEAIASGTEFGTEASFPYMIGYQGIVNAVRYLNGGEINSKIDTGYYWVDKDNLDTPEAQLRVYE